MWGLYDWNLYLSLNLNKTNWENLDIVETIHAPIFLFRREGDDKSILNKRINDRLSGQKVWKSEPFSPKAKEIKMKRSGWKEKANPRPKDAWIMIMTILALGVSSKKKKKVLGVYYTSKEIRWNFKRPQDWWMALSSRAFFLFVDITKIMSSEFSNPVWGRLMIKVWQGHFKQEINDLHDLCKCHLSGNNLEISSQPRKGRRETSSALDAISVTEVTKWGQTLRITEGMASLWCLRHYQH